MLTVPFTTHLIVGLKFDDAGTLWAFDNQAFVVFTVDRQGRAAQRDFGARPFSNANFLKDGGVLLGEHLVGSDIKPEIAARMGTRFKNHAWHRSLRRRSRGALLEGRQAGQGIRDGDARRHGRVPGRDHVGAFTGRVDPLLRVRNRTAVDAL